MLTEFLQIVQRKVQIDKTQEWYKGSITYFEGLKDETLEVEEETKDNNQVYLEDELGDILWTYLNLIEGLKQEGKISSFENIIARAEKKFGERVSAIDGGETQEIKSAAWEEIKIRQKKENKEEHEKLYS